MKNSMASKGARERKSLLLLPLLLTPFLTLGFWALGGGKTLALKPTTASGLNLELPNPSSKKATLENKFDVYQQAEQDSAKRLAQRKSDPLYRIAFPPDTVTNLEQDTRLYNPAPPSADAPADSPEQQVYRKLAALNQQLQLPPSLHEKQAAIEPLGRWEQNRVETAPGAMKELQPPPMHDADAKSADPELEQLNGLMDKIIAIQHPQSKNLLEQRTTVQAQVYPVKKAVLDQHVGQLDTAWSRQNPSAGFYSLENDKASRDQNAIEAVVHQTQTLKDGGLLKLRLSDAISIGGTIIPKGTFVFGKATLSGERLQVAISSLQYRNSLFFIKLDVYDLDGMPGLYIPGGAKNITPPLLENPLQNLTTIDPSLKTQAATAGMNAVKTLFTKRAKTLRVTIKAGYKVLLK